MAKRQGANKQRKRSETRRKVKSTASDMFKRLSLIVVVCVLAGGVFFGLYKLYAWTEASPIFEVKTIEIDTTRHVGRADVLKQAAFGQQVRITHVNTANAKKAIEKLVWVREAEVSRRFPDKIVIRITERVPIALINGGSVEQVDDQGVLLPFEPGIYSDLPLLSGLHEEFPEKGIRKLDVVSVDRMNNFFKQATSAAPALRGTIAQIDFSRDDVVRLTLKTQRAVISLNQKRIGQNIDRLCRLLDIVDYTSGMVPSQIDLSFGNLAFVR